MVKTPSELMFGNPPAAKHKPSKADIVAYLSYVEQLIQAAATGENLAPNWSALSAQPGARALQQGSVPTSDTGTHTDPITGVVVNNAGTYSWSASPPGWRRVADYLDMAAILAAIAAVQAATAADRFSVASFKQMFRHDGNGGLRIGDSNGNWVAEIGEDGVLVIDGMLRMTRGDDGGIQFGDSFGNFPLEIDGDGRLRAVLAPATITTATFGDSVVIEETISGKQQISAINSAGAKTQISDGTANDRYPQLIGKAISFVSDRYAATLRPMRMQSDGKSVMSSFGSTLVTLFVGYGQSLAVGVTPSGGQLYSTTALFNGSVLRFNKGIRPIGEQTVPAVNAVIPPANIDRLVPLTAVSDGTIYWETHLETLANRFMSQSGQRSIAVSTGVGGATIEQLARGGTPYFNTMQAIRSVYEIVSSLGWDLRVVMTFDHGEANDGNTRLAYKTKVLQLYDDFAADIKMITRQSDFHMFAMQTSALNQSQIPLAQWDASKERPNIHLVGPAYQNPYSDAVHPTSIGYTYRGDEYYDAVKTVLVDGLPWVPLQPVSVSRTNAEISILFEGLVGSPVLETTIVPDVGVGKGLEYTDGSGAPPTITAVAAIAGGFKITLSATPTGANKVVRAAYTRPGTLPTATGGARTNLADQRVLAATQTPGRNLPKRAIHFELSVN